MSTAAAATDGATVAEEMATLPTLLGAGASSPVAVVADGEKSVRACNNLLGAGASSPVAVVADGEKSVKTCKSVKTSKSAKSARSRGNADLQRSTTMLARANTALSRAGTVLQRAGTNVQLQRAASLPTEPNALRHAATMPMLHDMEADRPWWGGLWKTQQLIGFVVGIVLLLVLCLKSPMHTYPLANYMLGITALVACFWVFEVIPLPATALLPVVLMPFFEITSSEIASQAYWNWIQLVFVGVFFVDIALEQVQLHRRVALWLLLRTGLVSPAVLLGSFMFLSWLLSLFCNSIAVTLLISPVAITLLNATEEHARDQAAEGAQSKNAADPESGEADEAHGDPAHQSALDASHASEVVADEVRRLSDAVMLGIAYGTTSGGLGTIVGSIPNFLLAGQPIVTQQVTWGSWFLFASPLSLCLAVLAYLVLYCRYLWGLQFKGIARDVLEHEWQDLHDEIGSFSRDEAAVAAVQVLQIVLFIIQPWAISPLVRTSYGDDLVNDSTLACLPALLLFFIPSVVRPGQAVLTWQAVHEHFDFGMVLLIGGSFAINQGFSESGLNIALGDAFAKITSHHSPLAVQFIIIICIACATQLFSGIGAASTMLPALGSSAMQAVQNPMLLLLPATVGCSFAFMLPTAMPSNVVVLAKSQELATPLRIRDFFFTGLPLTILAWIVGSFVVYGMGAAVFDSHGPLSKETCSELAASCLWLDVPGTVSGRWVESQACMLVDQQNNQVCKLWDGSTRNITGTLAHLYGAS